MKLMLIAVSLCLISVSAFAAKANAKDEAAIRAFDDKFVAAWNAHDAKAMAAMWAEDGTLINPAGRAAHGRAEVEKLINDEHTTMLKATKAEMSVASIQWVKPDVAIVDHDMTIAGATSPDGKAMPDMKMHVTTVQMKKAGKWWLAACRPYSFHQHEEKSARNEAGENKPVDAPATKSN